MSEIYYCESSTCWGDCNRCGRWLPCRRDESCWPAGDGKYYGRLCTECCFQINEPEKWEEQRLEFIHKHSE